MIKVLIADDEPLVQIGLNSMLDWESLDMEVCGIAANGDSAYELILEHRPEIVITDIQMPCSSGLDLARRCREELGDLPVFIILTSHESFTYAREAIACQVIDYLVKELNLSFSHAGYAAAHLEMPLSALSGVRLSPEQHLTLYNSALHMLQELIGKYLTCRIIALDTRRFAAVFYLTGDQLSSWKELIRDALRQAFEMLYNYYSVRVIAGIGRLVEEPRDLSSSYNDARQLVGSVSEDEKIAFWDSLPDSTRLRNVFNLSLFRKEIKDAFETLDEEALHTVFANVFSILSADTVHYSQALDAASSILHFTITLLPEGGEIASTIFCDEPDTYCSLYRQKTSAAVLQWLKQLEDGLCKELPAYKSRRRNYLVELTKQYIREHLNERIVLQDIADTFNVSPNYLSQLFKKNEAIGISEYISHAKIEKSMELLRDGTCRIYEIADMLGFESAFYFSKVFKKVTGISPKDYRNG